MERQFERHQKCSLTFEDFTTLAEKSGDCPMCHRIDPNWHCLGGSHPRLLGAPGPGASAAIPPFREAIYILMKSPIDCERAGWIFVGTACAVYCDTKNLLLTAGHCVEAGEEDECRFKFRCTSHVEREAGAIRFPPDSVSFDVEILLAKGKPDIAVLRRCDGRQFSNEDMIPLCPPEEFPWRQNPKGWSGEVMCFYCPITEYVLNTSMETLQCEISQWFQIAKISRTQLKISTSFQEGSSGGAVVLKSNGCLIGILIEVAPFGELVLESASYVQQTERQIEMSKDMEKIDNSKYDGDLNSVSTSIHSVTKSHGTSTIILMPSELSFSYRNDVIDLYDWIRRGGPNTSSSSK